MLAFFWQVKTTATRSRVYFVSQQGYVTATRWISTKLTGSRKKPEKGQIQEFEVKDGGGDDTTFGLQIELNLRCNLVA